MKLKISILFSLLLFATIRVSAVIPVKQPSEKNPYTEFGTEHQTGVSLWIEDESDDMLFGLDDTDINFKKILLPDEHLPQGAGIIILSISHLDPLSIDKPPPEELTLS